MLVSINKINKPKTSSSKTHLSGVSSQFQEDNKYLLVNLVTKR